MIRVGYDVTHGAMIGGMLMAILCMFSVPTIPIAKPRAAWPREHPSTEAGNEDSWRLGITHPREPPQSSRAGRTLDDRPFLILRED